VQGPSEDCQEDARDEREEDRFRKPQPFDGQYDTYDDGEYTRRRSPTEPGPARRCGCAVPLASFTFDLA
jgi:hypothetical protein